MGSSPRPDFDDLPAHPVMQSPPKATTTMRKKIRTLPRRTDAVFFFKGMTKNMVAPPIFDVAAFVWRTLFIPQPINKLNHLSLTMAIILLAISRSVPDIKNTLLA